MAEMLYDARKQHQYSRANLADLCNEMPGAPDGISAEFIRDLEDRLAKLPIRDLRFWFVVEGLGIQKAAIQETLAQ